MTFEVQKSMVGAGFDVVFDGHRMWFKQAMTPLQAAILGIQHISSNGGPPPSELVNATADLNLRKSIMEFVQSTMRKVERPVEQPITRAEALAFLESAIRKTDNQHEAMGKGQFYTRIAMMQTEAEFQEHPGYPAIAAEVRVSRGK